MYFVFCFVISFSYLFLSLHISLIYLYPLYFVCTCCFLIPFLPTFSRFFLVFPRSLIYFHFVYWLPWSNSLSSFLIHPFPYVLLFFTIHWSFSLIFFPFCLYFPSFLSFLIISLSLLAKFYCCICLSLWIPCFRPVYPFPAPSGSTICHMNLGIPSKWVELWPLHAKRPAELPAECKCLVESVRPAINEIVLSNSTGAVAGTAGYCTWNIDYYLPLTEWEVFTLRICVVDFEIFQIIFILVSKECFQIDVDLVKNVLVVSEFWV